MRLRYVVTLVALLVVVAPAAAIAKERISVTVVAPNGSRVTVDRHDHRDQFDSLVEATDTVTPVSEPDLLAMLLEGHSVRRGPRFELRWGLGHGAEGADAAIVIRHYAYPYAEAGPLVFVPARYEDGGTGRSRGAWFHGGSELVDVIEGLGFDAGSVRAGQAVTGAGSAPAPWLALGLVAVVTAASAILPGRREGTRKEPVGTLRSMER